MIDIDMDYQELRVHYLDARKKIEALERENAILKQTIEKLKDKQFQGFEISWQLHDWLADFVKHD